MNNLIKKIPKYKTILKYWKDQTLNFINSLKETSKIVYYLRDWKRFSTMSGIDPKIEVFPYPILNEKTYFTRFDSHYFYQDIWAFKKIFASNCEEHIDVGSKIEFVGYLTTITKVIFIDIRPLDAYLENLTSKKGDILSMPFKNNRVSSLSCLHVAEHIGLGRYGDTLDPLGTEKAAKELSRILAPEGNLYFSLPIGKPKLLYNAHRIHSTKQILNYFSDLRLMELSGITDKKEFIININPKILDSCQYGCGLFWFKKTR